jgi:DNA-binding CsgD family transcriptional regulator
LQNTLILSNPKGSGDKGGRVALLTSESDGKVVDQNQAATSLLGKADGRHCWEFVGSRAGGVALPCREGCVHRIVDAGIEGAKSHRVLVDGKPFQLSCAAAGEQTVSILAPLQPPQVDLGGRALTTRETEVLQLLARGLTTPKIGESLGIKPATVRTHLEHLRAKLRVNTQAAVVAEGYKRGYL